MTILTLSPGQESAVDYERLVTQLRLVVDDYNVVPRDVGANNPFVSSEPLSEEVIRRIMEGLQADVAIWVTPPPSPSQYGADLQLNMILHDRPGVLSRSTKMTNREELEAELALVVRERLQGLLEGEPSHQRNAAPESLQAKKTTPTALPGQEPRAAHTKDDAPSSDRGRFAAGMAFLARGGIWGSSGPVSQLGLTIDALWLPTRSLHLRLSISAAFKNDVLQRAMDLFWCSLELGLSIGYLWQMGPFSLGPEIGAFYLWSYLRVTPNPKTELKSSWSNFHAALGPTFRWAVTAWLALCLAGAVGIVPAARRFEDMSDQSTIISQPLVDWKITVGALLFF